MRFSIRSLLAVILLCGVLFPLVRGLAQVDRDEMQREQLSNEIGNLREQLTLDNPERQLLRQHQREQRDAMHELRMIAEQKFAVIQRKYGDLQSRGAGVVSLRTIPQLNSESLYHSVVFHLKVPDERKVWMKYAVADREEKHRDSKQLDKIQTGSGNTGFENDGQYEVQLSSGDHLIEVRTGPVTENILPISVLLDDVALLTGRYVSEGKPSSGSYHVSGRQQLDYDSRRTLPWLLNIDIREQLANEKSRDSQHHGIVWSSDQSSGFDPFPGSSGEAVE